METMTRTETSQTNTSRIDRTKQYADDVVSGKIIAGPHVRNACRRHLQDLETAHERGLFFDLDEADKTFRFFEDVLKLSEGQFEGKPFDLHPSQCFILGSLFAWKREDGRRRFNRAYIEQGKGNGKSPLAGGIGLRGLCADGEAGAQIYAAAAKRDQAGILFADAVKMVRQSPALAKRLEFSGGRGREFNIAHHASNSFFRPVSRDAGKTGSGPRPYFVLADEVHELPDRSIIEMLERGFKFRENPLLFMITNSGSDRNSVAWEEHEHAVKVAAGHTEAVNDPTFVGDVIDDNTFSYVCALDSNRTITYDVDVSLCHMLKLTICNAQTTQIELPSPQDFADLVLTKTTGLKTLKKDLDVKTIQTAQPFLDAFATLVTEGLENKEGRKLGRLEESILGNTQNLNEPKSLLGQETQNIGKKRKKKTQAGKLTEPEKGSTEYPLNKSLTLNLNKEEGAGFADVKRVVYGWTIATIQALYVGCYATNAMLESACLVIIKNLYEKHSVTCKTLPRFRLKSGRLTEDLPADDPLTDPSCWIKANPLLGVTITEEYLAQTVKQAKSIVGQLNGILRLHFCVWTDAEAAWMSRDTFEPLIADFDIKEHEGKTVSLGLDLSQNQDITALGAVVETGTKLIVDEQSGEEYLKPTYDAWVEAWTPDDTLIARETRDKLPYSVWKREGHIHAPAGKNINFRHVAQTLAEYCNSYLVSCVAYDRYAFKRFEEDVAELGLDVEFVEHPQGGTKKGKPTEEQKQQAEAEGRTAEGLWMPGSVSLLEEAILEGRIRFKRNPVLISAVMSAVIEEDKWGNHWLAKTRSLNKIDAIIALAMAFGAAQTGSSDAAFDNFLRNAISI